MSETARTFIAIMIPEAVRAEVLELQQRMKAAIGREKIVRWTAAEQLHLTIRFLGNTPATQTAAIIEALRALGNRERPFELHLRGGGCFPSCANPRIIWTSVSGSVDDLLRVQNEVVRATAEYGEPPETRAWKPHLTIARVRAETLPDQRQVGYTVRDFEFPDSSPWRVGELLFIRSDLSPKGSTYTTLAAIPLGRAEAA